MDWWYTIISIIFSGDMVCLLYFQVIWFDSESDRKSFVRKLRHGLHEVGKVLYVKTTTWKDIQRRACTKKKRQELLAKFFKTVFSEVHHHF